MALTGNEGMKHFNHLFDEYSLLPKNYDEIFSTSKTIRNEAKFIVEYFNQFAPHEYEHLHSKAHSLFLEQGVTFGAPDEKNEKIFPFDLIPRVITAAEWKKIERGLIQRIKALNLFLIDIYHKQHILKSRVIPKEMILSASGYLPQLQNIIPQGKTHVHVAGIDIIRDEIGNYVILEDNLRVPSGVSYALTNRHTSQILLPQLMNAQSIYPIDEYPSQLSATLHSLTECQQNDLAVVLTPGPFNSAYYEHAYLAKAMNWPLVEGKDLYVRNNEVFMRTAKGSQRVKIIYRRIDDTFLDPTSLNPESLIGVPGLMQAYQAGNVLLANAPGTGVADDKAVFAYVPQMIKFYLDEDPILPQVETFLCAQKKELNHVLNNMDKLVVKMVDQSGGFGLLIGPQANKNQIDEFRKLLQSNPRKFIAQPLVEFSSSPTMCGGKMMPKRIDFRPYVLSGISHWIMPGGLSRVALAENSYVVNSCQGGGSKDTWIMKSRDEK